MDNAIQNEFESPFYYLNQKLTQHIYRPRKRDAHKGQQGSVLLIAGSGNMAGAAIIAGKSALRSGCGLCTLAIPEIAKSAAFTLLPEALQLEQDVHAITEKHSQKAYQAIGIGSGLGQSDHARELLKTAMDLGTPIVLDADALNMLAADGKPFIPAGAIITPHIGEFDRLFGLHKGSAERLDTAIKKAVEGDYTIVLKGHRTAVVCRDGRVAMSLKGNAILAKGGSGDVLCGMLTAMLAQGYNNFEAACLSVYLHGVAADVAAEDWAAESLLSGELCDYISEAFIFMTHAEENA